MLCRHRVDNDISISKCQLSVVRCLKLGWQIEASKESSILVTDTNIGCDLGFSGPYSR